MNYQDRLTTALDRQAINLAWAVAAANVVAGGAIAAAGYRLGGINVVAGVGLGIISSYTRRREA